MPLTESGFLPQIDYTARDFDTIRGALVKHLQNYFPNDWQDFALSNLGTAIMELVAFVGDQLSFYLDRTANEMFLPTVTQRRNAINLVNLIGYVPRTTAAASVALQATLASQASPTILGDIIPLVITDQNGNPWEFLEQVTIPAGRTDTKDIQVTDEVLGEADGVSATYSFITDNENVSLGTATLTVTIATVQYGIIVDTDGSITLPGGGAGLLDYSTGDITLSFAPATIPDASTDITLTYQYTQKITVYQGRTRSQVFSSTGLPLQEYTLESTPVLLSPIISDETIVPDPNRFEVWIGDPGAPFGNETGTKWRRVDTLVTAGPDEEVYELRVDELDRVIVVFGDNIAGAIPETGTNNITVIYRTGGGRAGNINIGDLSTTVTGSTGFFGVPVALTNFERGSGGAERESIDEIRVNAPAYLRTNDTATTEQDFDSLALFSQSGQGAVVRAKSRLTPSDPVTTKTVHSAVSLGTVPNPAVLEYYLRLPATPALVDTISLQYTTAAGVQSASATDLGSGLAQLSNDAGSTGLDSTLTRLRYDEQDIVDDVPGTFVGDGTTLDFNGTLTYFPIFPGSIIFRYTIGGTDYVGLDDGNGTLVGTNVNSTLSTVNYATGVTRVVFGTRPTITSGNAETYDLDSLNGGGPTDLVYSIDGGGDVTITFVSGDFVDHTACTAAEIAAKINATTAGFADGSSGRVVLTGSTIGASGTIQIKAAGGNPDANGELGFATSLISGTEFPPDAASVISFDYQSALRLVLTTLPEVGTDIVISMESGPTLKEFPTNNIEVYVLSEGPDGELTASSSALKDSLKSFLDLRRVLGTSVQILDGFIVKVNYFLEVEFDPSISQVETQNRIIEAIEELFADPVQVTMGGDVPVAAAFDAIFPLQGVIAPTVEEVSIRVPIGTGDGATAIFQDSDDETPGQYLDTDKLPGVTGVDKVKVYLDDVQIGRNVDTNTITSLGTLTGSSTSVLGTSTFDLATGEFDVRLSPAPDIGQVLALEYSLNQASGGVKLWNVAINPWEIGVLGEIWINGVRVRTA